MLPFFARLPHVLDTVSNSLKIALYFLGTLLFGALLAPPLFWAGHALGALVPPLGWLRATDFQRYFDRAMFLAALLLLWPAVRALRIGGWRDLGLERDPRPWRHALGGFLLAGGGLWLLGGWLWHERIYAHRSALPMRDLASFLVSAVAVAVAEEAFFRGVLLGLARRTSRPTAALVFVSALFAVLHFFKPPPRAAALANVDWLSGFAFLPRTLWQWHDPLLVAGGVTTLFLVALVLGYARLRTRALWLPVGLHAGWVGGLKSFNKVSRHLAPPDFWVGDDLLHGLGPVLMVALTGLLVWVWLEKVDKA